MKTFIARHKKLFSFVGVLSLTVAFAVTASATSASYNYSTSRYQNSVHTNSDSTFNLKTEYHVGTTAPWDYAYVYSEAGALAGKYRYVSYNFGGHSGNDGSVYNLDYDAIHIGYEIPSQDTGTGSCHAETHATGDKYSTTVKSQTLTIS